MTDAERFPRRARQARHTRQRIVAAAIESFVTIGYPGTTIAGVAERADVAVQTVYASFGTKRALLAAAIDVAIAGDDEPVPVNDRPWMRPVWEATDGAGTLRAYAAAVCLIQSRVALLFRALDAGAAAESELRQLHTETAGRRRLGATGVIGAVKRHGPLAAGLSDEQAIDILWTLNGHEPWLSFVAGCGWAPDDYQAWLGSALVRLLLPPAAEARISSRRRPR